MKILFPVLFPLLLLSVPITIVDGNPANLENEIFLFKEEGAVR